jgi:thiamine biosynthesis protein ThiS
VPEGLTLASLVDWLHLPADRVAIEHNLEIVSRKRWSETTIDEGDRLEVVHFVGGGREDSESYVSLRTCRRFHSYSAGPEEHA